MSNTTHKSAVRFAALDPYIQRNIPVPVAVKVSGTDRYKWGQRDRYPSYLLDLYNKAATLRAVIDGCVDYIAGDAVRFRGSDDVMLNEADNARDVVRLTATQLKRVGGFALQVVRDYTGAVRYVYSLDLRYVRTNEDNTVFWYSERWGKADPSPEVMPAFIPFTPEEWARLDEDARNAHTSSIYWYKERRDDIYPQPCYLASIPACETEANVDDYHLNSLENGFAASALINFNNGVPSEEEQDEIERHVCEKFAGHENALRIMLAFNDNKDRAATIEQLDVPDYGERFSSLEKTVRQKIFTAFRANPNLFGIPTDSLGFSSEEYESAFKLFNRTQVQPAQRAIIDAFTKIYGEPVLTIEPFSLDGPGTQTIQ